MRGFTAGGKHPKRSSPPTTAASPKFGRPPRILLRPAFARRRRVAVARMSSDEHPAYRSWRFPPVKVLSPEENIQKDHHLRPPRLRRSSAARHAASSGQHSLAGVDFAGASLSSDECPPHRSWQFPPVRSPSAGGKHPKRLSPPTTAASPKFGRPPRTLLRQACAPRS